jgi:hypothetical protein
MPEENGIGSSTENAMMDRMEDDTAEPIPQKIGHMCGTLHIL